MLHIFLHILVPLAVAATFFRSRLLASYAIMMAAMLIDIDHLLAEPIYAPERCSIGFHPLHTALPIVFYGAALLYPRTRILGLGLCLHIGLDALDSGCRTALGW
ncbi:MAG: DUF6122 family protein [Halioglobus sp.]